MPYGIIKIDTVTFTDAGVDKSVTLSGLVQNPTFSGNVTVTGTLSGVTVTGTTANFTSGNFTNISGGTHTITSGVFAAGSAASPSITFTGDLNTGIYSPGADQVAISTGGSGRLFVDASGRVGINSAPSLWLLEVKQDSASSAGGAYPVIQVNNPNANGYAGVYLNDSTAQAGLETQRNTGHLGLQAGGSERLRITAAGLVGVGTSSPGALLDAQATSGNAKIQAKETTTNKLFQIEANTAYHALYGAGAVPVYLYSNGSIAMTLDSSQRVGIGTTSPQATLHAHESGSVTARIRITNSTTTDATGRGLLLSQQGTSAYITNNESGDLVVSNNGSEAFRVDSDRRLLVGTSSSVSTGGGANIQQIASPSNDRMLGVHFGGGSATGPYITFSKSRSSTYGSYSIVNSGDVLGGVIFAGDDGTDYATQGAYIEAYVDGTPGVNDLPTRLVFSTTADGASSPTERMRIGQDGRILIGDTSSTSFGDSHRITRGTSENGVVLSVDGGTEYSSLFRDVAGGNYSTAAAAQWVGRNTTSLRSINAGGTVNASGADYAEYMVKAGDFDIAKGAVCGVTAYGLLTLNYSEAVSFVVKSTNPSYVGGDTWGNESAIGKRPQQDDTEALAQWEAVLEAARQKVDRIAFAGQVPVNVTSATPGQYIIPVETADGSIKGIAKNEDELTLTEYMHAVGKVIAIEDDGRARIIVKVA